MEEAPVLKKPAAKAWHLGFHRASEFEAVKRQGGERDDFWCSNASESSWFATLMMALQAYFSVLEMCCLHESSFSRDSPWLS